MKRATTVQDPVREQVIALLRGGNAHVTFEAAIKNWPAAKRGVVPKGAEHSAWELLEHMRIAQSDILEFSRNPKHVSPEWPSGYWPETKTPSEAAWKKSIASFNKDLQAIQDLVADPATDLYKKLSHGTGQNILREALLVADHNAYHLGQLLLVRRLLGEW